MDQGAVRVQISSHNRSYASEGYTVDIFEKSELPHLLLAQYPGIYQDGGESQKGLEKYF